jgi:hypothetical protein
MTIGDHLGHVTTTAYWSKGMTGSGCNGVDELKENDKLYKRNYMAKDHLPEIQRTLKRRIGSGKENMQK